MASNESSVSSSIAIKKYAHHTKIFRIKIRYPTRPRRVVLASRILRKSASCFSNALSLNLFPPGSPPSEENPGGFSVFSDGRMNKPIECLLNTIKASIWNVFSEHNSELYSSPGSYKAWNMKSKILTKGATKARYVSKTESQRQYFLGSPIILRLFSDYHLLGANVCYHIGIGNVILDFYQAPSNHIKAEYPVFQTRSPPSSMAIFHFFHFTLPVTHGSP